VSAEISECEIYEKPCFYKGAGRMRGSYIRVGEADQPMTEYEIYSYEVFKRKIQDELRIVERADIQSFDENALAEYFIKIKNAKPNLAKQTNEKILSLQGFLENGKPTVAGIMVLGEYPQAYFPQLSITAMVVAGTKFGDTGENGERFIDNKRIEGTIPQMLNDTLAFVRRNSRNATIINDEGLRADRTQYPMKAVREILLNALIHRDYSIHTDNSPVRVILYDDRLEVENPGGLYGRITIDDLGKMSADTRNPFIAGGLEVLIDTENRFSGIPTIRDEMRSAGLPPAIFESKRGIFKVTLYNKQMSNLDNAVFKNLGDIPSRILTFCKVPRSREEIAGFLGVDSAYYVVTKYLRPLIESKKIGMTLPKTPKSKNQRYFVI
jgi:ATP-dependent DNA helicase RecG